MCNQGLQNSFCVLINAIVFSFNKFKKALNKEQNVQIMFCKDGFKFKFCAILRTQLRF